MRGEGRGGREIRKGAGEEKGESMKRGAKGRGERRRATVFISFILVYNFYSPRHGVNVNKKYIVFSRKQNDVIIDKSLADQVIMGWLPTESCQPWANFFNGKVAGHLFHPTHRSKTYYTIKV